MKLVVTLIMFIILGCWLALSYFLLGHVEFTGVQLSLPKTTSDFSDSTGILNGLFSSFAVVLALVAVLLQGRELKESTLAQNDQAQSLKEQLAHQQQITKTQLERSQAIVNQLEQQQITNKILMLQTQQQYHSSEVNRMDILLERIDGDFDKSDLYKNSVDKKKEHINHLKRIQASFNEIQ